ncbi:MAG: recombination mediator RecR [Gemmatimonadota bacterium]|uniref:recombination mediator RecR n=1 Tax=Candidatus Palauibacter soopunensis TaxID=3056739 RepID=UPI00238A686B|nr:recombination mediator RecR [Candidatus Palauibacter soopunensis]MDE2878799.1 recombination mediator RecR [Candidatus Palauibacter soopunensis]MDE2945092.1 recombination mediator RecR [Gemmatimonadota bacterium]
MNAIEALVGELGRLPGIGRKTARRLTYHLLKSSKDDARRLARALERVAAEVRVCGDCGNLSDMEPCEYCRSPRRDPAQVCVVEEASDIPAIENSGNFGGMYHVLGGRLSPLDGVGPEDLNIKALLRRLDTPVREVIIATNASVEGEATATYLQRLLASAADVTVTRLARGLPVGGDLEYADGVTIAEAFAGRREM